MEDPRNITLRDISQGYGDNYKTLKIDDLHNLWRHYQANKGLFANAEIQKIEKWFDNEISFRENRPDVQRVFDLPTPVSLPSVPTREVQKLSEELRKKQEELITIESDIKSYADSILLLENKYKKHINSVIRDQNIEKFIIGCIDEKIKAYRVAWDREKIRSIKLNDEIRQIKMKIEEMQRKTMSSKVIFQGGSMKRYKLRKIDI